MSEPVYQSREAVTPTGNGVVRDQVVATTSPARPYARAQRIIELITGVLLTLLAFRFVFSLLGANRGNGFAAFIYGITYPFVAPFYGLFGYQMQYGVSRFEFEALVAMAVWALVGYAVAKLIAVGRVR